MERAAPRQYRTRGSLRVVGIPSYVLIAPDGKVAAMWSGYGEGSIEARIEQLVK